MTTGASGAGKRHDTEMKTDNQQGETPTRLPRAAQEMIGRRLKAAYDDLTKEPIPANLLALIDELEAKEKGR